MKDIKTNYYNNEYFTLVMMILKIAADQALVLIVNSILLHS